MFKIYLCIATLFMALDSQCQRDTLKYIDSIEMAIQLGEFVHTAQYKPTHVKKALHPIEIITSEVLEKRGVTKLDEALLLVPSVRFNYDPILGTQLKLRGISSSNVAILIDGIPVIGRLDGAIDISQISLNNVKQIEVIEGPLSTIYGNNAAGGVINIITNQNQRKRWSLNASSQLESIGTQNHLMDIGFQSKRWYVNARGRFNEYSKYGIDSLRTTEKFSNADGTTFTRNKYPWNPKTQIGGGTTIKYNMDLENSIAVKYDFNDEEVRDYGSIKRPQFKPYANDEFFLTRREDISLVYDGHLFNKLYVEFTSAYNQFERKVNNKRYDFEPMRYDPEKTISDTTIFRTFFNRLNFSTRINPSLELIAGLNYTHDVGMGDRIKAENEGMEEATISEVAVYADARYALLKGMTISYSGRFLSQNVFGNNFTSALKAKYDIGDDITLRASYAQGYRSPDLKELFIEFIDINHYIIGNKDLQPERSNDFQLTAQYDPCSWVDAKLNVYKTFIKDKISLVQYGNQKYNYQNVDRYDVYGAQLDLGGSWSALNWNLASSLGYWNTNINTEGTSEQGRIVDFSANLNYQIPKIKIGTSLNYRLVGAQPLYTFENEDVMISTISSTDFLDVSLNRSFWKNRIQIVTGCKNIMNTTQTTINGAAGGGLHGTSGSQLINQGRSYFVRLGVKF